MNIKTQKCWRYEDDLCVGCGVKSETGEEFDGEVSDRKRVAKELIRKLKIRDKILDLETP